MYVISPVSLCAVMCSQVNMKKEYQKKQMKTGASPARSSLTLNAHQRKCVQGVLKEQYVQRVVFTHTLKHQMSTLQLYCKVIACVGRCAVMLKKPLTRYCNAKKQFLLLLCKKSQTCYYNAKKPHPCYHSALKTQLFV